MSCPADATPEAAEKEAFGLGFGMAKKHAAHNTGFSGAKVVCNIPDGGSIMALKPELLQHTSELLNAMGGAMYTGCDINSSLADMNTMMDMHNCPRILASLGQPADPSVATAAGVVGSLDAALGGLQGKTILVHGVGKVGEATALMLRDGGARVLATDIVPGLAKKLELAGIEDVSSHPAWWTLAADAVAPCSGPYLFTEDVVKEMQQPMIVGATNLPFASPEAYAECIQRDIVFVPEGISSAGAVIEDSVEFYANEDFVNSNPMELYAFARRCCFDQTELMLDALGSDRDTVAAVEGKVKQYHESDEKPLGLLYPAFCNDLRSKLRVWLDYTAGDSVSGLVKPRKQATSTVHKAHVKSYSTTSAQRARGPVSSAFRWSRMFSAAATPPQEDTADVVIVGGGIMGLSVAYQLKRRDPSMRVQILEQGSQLGNGSSGWSTGFLRAYYSFDETMQLALDGIGAYKNWQEFLQDDQAEAFFTETGSLWMLGYDAPTNDTMAARLGQFGVNADVLDADGIKDMYPQINTDPLPRYNHETGEEIATDLGNISAVFEHGCGHMDSNLCLSDMLRVCQREGVEIKFGTKVERVDVTDNKDAVSGVTLESGERISAGVVVNAAGPWVNSLNSTTGVDLGINTTALPTRIQVGTLRDVPADFLKLPFVADAWGASGIYFMPREASGELVFGSVDHRFESEIVDDPDQLNTALDPDVKADYLGCLFHRLPSLPQNLQLSGFSSMYTVNQDDVHPMIGETKLRGMWACNGFSGHGFKLAPAVGSLVAQQTTHQRTDAWEADVPHEFLAPERESLQLKVKTHLCELNAGSHQRLRIG